MTSQKAKANVTCRILPELVLCFSKGARGSSGFEGKGLPHPFTEMTSNVFGKTRHVQLLLEFEISQYSCAVPR